jgi:hypothetical protein
MRAGGALPVHDVLEDAQSRRRTKIVTEKEA